MRKHLKPNTPASCSGRSLPRLPGTAPPQKPTSTWHRPAALARLASSAAGSTVGGTLLSGMSMRVVIPPAAAARVAVAKPSHSVRPGSLTWTWVSTRPGSRTTSSPYSTTRSPVSAEPSGSTAVILPPVTPMHRPVSPAPVMTRRARMTRSWRLVVSSLCRAVAVSAARAGHPWRSTAGWCTGPRRMGAAPAVRAVPVRPAGAGSRGPEVPGGDQLRGPLEQRAGLGHAAVRVGFEVGERVGGVDADPGELGGGERAPAGHGDHGHPVLARGRGHARRGLAVEGLRVQGPLAGDDERGSLDRRPEAEHVEQEGDARAQGCPEHGDRGEPDPARGP